MLSEFKKYHSQMKDKMGCYRINTLFWETRNANYAPLFTTKDEAHTVDGIVYPSLKPIYFLYDHIPGYEYEFALDVFGSWEHWVAIAKSFPRQGSIGQAVRQWREEMEIRNKATALKSLAQAARGEGNGAIAAARYLAEKGWEVKRGRPSKEEVERETRVQAGVNRDLQADMDRLGLKVL